MPLLCPMSVETTAPLAGSSRLIRPESESAASVGPCQQQPTCMSATCGAALIAMVRSGSPLPTPHTLTVLSAEAVASRAESGDHAHA